MDSIRRNSEMGGGTMNSCLKSALSSGSWGEKLIPQAGADFLVGNVSTKNFTGLGCVLLSRYFFSDKSNIPDITVIWRDHQNIESRPESVETHPISQNNVAKKNYQASAVCNYCPLPITHPSSSFTIINFPDSLAHLISTMTNITVLISGSGSNLQALLDAQKAGNLGQGTITQVISSSATAYGLTRAEKAGVTTRVHALKEYYKGIPKEETEKRKQQRDKFNRDLAEILVHGLNRPDLVVCAGWMLILSPAVLEPLEKADIGIINLHPALPGAFDGTHAIERAWQAGQDGIISKGGVMIHRVIAAVDLGAPILVCELDLKKDESLDAYEARVHETEHEAIVKGTRLALAEIEQGKKTEKPKPASQENEDAGTAPEESERQASESTDSRKDSKENALGDVLELAEKVAKLDV